MAPIAVAGISNLLAEATNAESTQEDAGSARDGFKLTDFASPFLIGVAVALYVAYISIELLQWDSGSRGGTAKIVVFTLSNLFIVGMIAWTLYKARQENIVEGTKDYQNLKRTLPALILVSIGVSVYSLAKQLLIDLDLHQLRPIMMSAALQLLALLTFDRVLPRATRDF